MFEDLKITIGRKRYEELLNIETRMDVLSETIKTSEYAPNRKELATILGIELEKKEK